MNNDPLAEAILDAIEPLGIESAVAFDCAAAVRAYLLSDEAVERAAEAWADGGMRAALTAALGGTE